MNHFSAVTRAPYLILLFFFIFSVDRIYAQNLSAGDLKKLSLEELMNIEVTLVSRQSQKLSEVASAIQVITSEEINRSTATYLPEALSLLPNLQTSRLNSYAWVISARGFNYIFANKLLVMIDGRTVYSPLLAGTYWDVQSVFMEDIDRIESVSGPGGTLWGANAVNGVINVVTKSSKNTQGLYVSGLLGSYVKDWGGLRYGGKIGSKFSYRVFVQRHNFNPFLMPNGQENADNWNIAHGGFRIDGEPSEKDAVMLQGNLNGGIAYTEPSRSTFDGQSVLGRWSRRLSEKSDFVLQLYFDRTWRDDAPSTFKNQVLTYDLDFQHGFTAGKRHSILWGIGYRFIRDESQTDTIRVAFLPRKRNMPLYSAFVQDQIVILDDRLQFILGSKFQHNVYSGFEIQPSARLSFSPDKVHLVWGAVSRAVRAPSRIDVDFHIPGYEVPPGTPAVDGGPDFSSEKLWAYETGYRAQPFDMLSLSVAAFYNRYNDLFSVERLPDDTVRYQIMNGTAGYSAGLELSGIFRITPFWRTRGGYTYFQKTLSSANYDPSGLGHDPNHQLMMQSMLDLPGNFQLDIFCRYVDGLSRLEVPDYLVVNSRLAWLFSGLELSVAGRNIVRRQHREWDTFKIPRNFYGKIAWRF